MVAFPSVYPVFSGAANYDRNHPYRLVFGLHWLGGNAEDVATGRVVPTIPLPGIGFPGRSAWSMLVDRTGNLDRVRVHTLPCNGKARHVRITVTGLAAGCRASIRSFEVFDRPLS